MKDSIGAIARVAKNAQRFVRKSLSSWNIWFVIYAHTLYIFSQSSQRSFLIEHFSVSLETSEVMEDPEWFCNPDYGFLTIPWTMEKWNSHKNQSWQEDNAVTFKGHAYVKQCFVEQDLSITEERTRRLNHVIGELDLMIHNSTFEDVHGQVDLGSNSKRQV